MDIVIVLGQRISNGSYKDRGTTVQGRCATVAGRSLIGQIRPYGGVADSGHSSLLSQYATAAAVCLRAIEDRCDGFRAVQQSNDVRGLGFRTDKTVRLTMLLRNRTCGKRVSRAASCTRCVSWT
jgi:hypothetical protein